MNDREAIHTELRELHARVAARLAQTEGLSDRFRQLGAQGEPVHALHEAIRELADAAELITNARDDVAAEPVCEASGSQ